MNNELFWERHDDYMILRNCFPLWVSLMDKDKPTIYKGAFPGGVLVKKCDSVEEFNRFTKEMLKGYVDNIIKFIR